MNVVKIDNITKKQMHGRGIAKQNLIMRSGAITKLIFKLQQYKPSLCYCTVKSGIAEPRTYVKAVGYAPWKELRAWGMP